MPRFLPFVVCLFFLALAPEAAPGEPSFPQVGSHAYDVLHYDSSLFFKPEDG